ERSGLDLVRRQGRSRGPGLPRGKRVDDGAGRLPGSLERRYAAVRAVGGRLGAGAARGREPSGSPPVANDGAVSGGHAGRWRAGRRRCARMAWTADSTWAHGSRAPHTVHVRIAGVSASFFRLPYPLIAPVEPTPWGFGLAADADIAAMKLE